MKAAAAASVPSRRPTSFSRPWTRAALVAFTAAVTCAAGLAAQGPPAITQIPLVPGTVRDYDFESQLLKDGDAKVRAVRAYRIEASMEALFSWYQAHLVGKLTQPSDSIPVVEEGGTSQMMYWLAFHHFDDECMDPGAAAGASTQTCKVMRKGKDKRNALDRVRIPFAKGDWIEVATFTWYKREMNGALVRLNVVMRDIGLTPNWKRYEPREQLVFESEVVQPPTH